MKNNDFLLKSTNININFAINNIVITTIIFVNALVICYYRLSKTLFYLMQKLSAESDALDIKIAKCLCIYNL